MERWHDGFGRSRFEKDFCIFVVGIDEVGVSKRFACPPHSADVGIGFAGSALPVAEFALSPRVSHTPQNEVNGTLKIALWLFV